VFENQSAKEKEILCKLDFFSSSFVLFSICLDALYREKLMYYLHIIMIIIFIWKAIYSDTKCIIFHCNDGVEYRFLLLGKMLEEAFVSFLCFSNFFFFFYVILIQWKSNYRTLKNSLFHLIQKW
jgi:hypothetical protein